MAAWLLETLPPHGTEDGAAEGIEEAARRREEIDSGSVQATSADEFWEAIARVVHVRHNKRHPDYNLDRK